MLDKETDRDSDHVVIYLNPLGAKHQDIRLEPSVDRDGGILKKIQLMGDCERV